MSPLRGAPGRVTIDTLTRPGSGCIVANLEVISSVCPFRSGIGCQMVVHWATRRGVLRCATSPATAAVDKTSGPKF